MSSYQMLARRDTITDYPGRVLDNRPDYYCERCSHHIHNYPLEFLSRLLGRVVYGHVTCRCLMWSEVECKGYAKKSIDPITAQRKRYDDYDKKYAKQERNALQNMPW